MTADVSVVIPAYNEANRLQAVLTNLGTEYEVIVVDDGSTDGTVKIATEHEAKVLQNDANAGYLASLQRGFDAANGEIIVTMDADGEHPPSAIPRLVEPIRKEEYDLVFGARETIPRPSERILNRIARARVDTPDTGTGFRALTEDLASRLDLDTACTCGTFALEASAKGARIGERSVPTEDIDKPRRIAWEHWRQFFHVLRWLGRTLNTSD